jgi:aspartate racemase
MKCIGLIGGMSWESTTDYYRLINQRVREQCGGLHSAHLLLYSVDFAEVEALQRQGDWQQATVLMCDAAQRLERGGAECVVICTNTMHMMADAIQAHTKLPLLHIADSTAVAIQAGGLQRVGLLGTRFTMEQDFYRGRLHDNYGLEVLIPPADDRELVHRIIYDELCVGLVQQTAKQQYLAVIDRLIAQGAQGIIAGCTEIGLLLTQDDCPVPFFNTTELHAAAAVAFALEPIEKITHHGTD